MKLIGEEKIKRKLEKLAREMPGEIAMALYQEAEIEATESRHRTPVDLGTLKGSHEVSVEQTGRDIKATITVGGPAAPYAVYVHENEEAIHEVGRSKFLQSTILESKSSMLARVAKRIDLNRLVR